MQRAQVVKLDWDEPEDISAVLAAVGGQVDMVLAADCCYVDEVSFGADPAIFILCVYAGTDQQRALAALPSSTRSLVESLLLSALC